MLLMERTVNDFVDELASLSPAPGGGTIAAVNGAFAAGLGCMACSLTARKPKNEEAPAQLAPCFEELASAKENFLRYADEDTEAFNQVMAAFSLPKETEEEKAARKEAIAKANILATRVPLQTAGEAVSVCEVLVRVVSLANSNVLSDCGVALECAKTGALGAFMNVSINLPGVKDEAVARFFSEQLDALKQRLEAAAAKGAAALGERFEY